MTLPNRSPDSAKKMALNGSHIGCGRSVFPLTAREGNIERYIFLICGSRMAAAEAKAADTVLFQLKSLAEGQAENIALRLGITMQAVRQRLNQLIKEQLVTFQDYPQGQGRPRRLWSLTARAAFRFPDTHAQSTADLIGVIGAIRPELGEPVRPVFAPTCR